MTCCNINQSCLVCNNLNSLVDMVLYPNRPSNSISPIKIRLALENCDASNSDTDMVGSEKTFFIKFKFDLSAKNFGLGRDFFVQISNKIEITFWTILECSIITNSVGFDMSIDSNFEAISESVKFTPPEPICFSRFSARTSRTTSVGP